jgi:hypothetical protein
MENILEFVLQKEGYILITHKFISGLSLLGDYSVGNTRNLSFPDLVTELSSNLSPDFYNRAISIEFNEKNSLPFPEKERKAICSLVERLSYKSLENKELKERIERNSLINNGISLIT